MRFAAIPLLALSFVAGCHTGEECGDHALKRGVELEITLTELVSSSGCASATATVDDTLLLTTGDPVDIGSRDTCTAETLQVPAEADALYGVALSGACREQRSGFYCRGDYAGCSGQQAHLTIYLNLPTNELGETGSEAEGTSVVHIAAIEESDCPAFDCNEEFAVHAKRLN